MSNTVLHIENVSKRYILNQKGNSNDDLRDTITRMTTKVLKPSQSKMEKEEFWALKDINMEVKQGDRLGLVGANGAGKSTLLKVLSQITQPTSGIVKVRGRMASLLEVGTGFHPELTGRENIFLNGAILGMQKSEIIKHFDAIVDLPFALPTAVSGIALTTLYSSSGWFGQILEPLGIKIVFTPIGITIALIFIGLPFVVRTVQPALEEIQIEQEEASASLGASRWQTFYKVILPTIFPAVLTGFALSFARALGEYGSVVFIAGNMPFKTEISTLLIITKLEQYDFAGATAIAVVMLLISFVMLLLINILQRWSSRRKGMESI